MQGRLRLGVLRRREQRRAGEVRLQHAALEPHAVEVRRVRVVEGDQGRAGREGDAQRARVAPLARRAGAERRLRVLEERGAINIPLAVDHVRRAVEAHVHAVAAVQEPHELQLGRRHAVGRELDGDLDVGDGEAVEEGVLGRQGVRERGHPAPRVARVAQRRVHGHEVRLPVVRREHELPGEDVDVRVGAAERHDDVGRRRRGQRDAVAVAERRAVDAGPDRQRLAAHGGEGDVVLQHDARQRRRGHAVVVRVVGRRHDGHLVVPVALQHVVVGHVQREQRRRRPVLRLDRERGVRHAVELNALERVDVAPDGEPHRREGHARERQGVDVRGGVLVPFQGHVAARHGRDLREELSGADERLVDVDDVHAERLQEAAARVVGVARVQGHVHGLRERRAVVDAVPERADHDLERRGARGDDLGRRGAARVRRQRVARVRRVLVVEAERVRRGAVGAQLHLHVLARHGLRRELDEQRLHDELHVEAHARLGEVRGRHDLEAGEAVALRRRRERRHRRGLEGPEEQDLADGDDAPADAARREGLGEVAGLDALDDAGLDLVGERLAAAVLEARVHVRVGEAHLVDEVLAGDGRRRERGRGRGRGRGRRDRRRRRRGGRGRRRRRRRPGRRRGRRRAVGAGAGAGVAGAASSRRRAAAPSAARSSAAAQSATRTSAPGTHMAPARAA